MKVGQLNIPQHLQLNVLTRFMKEKELEVLWKSYEASKRRITASPPTALQVKMAEMRKSGKTNREVGAHFKVPPVTVGSALQRTAVWKYLHPNDK